MAVRLSGGKRSRRARRAVLLSGDGSSHKNHGDARHRLGRCGPFVVGSPARRQVPSDTRLSQLHLVQDRKTRHLPGPMRAPLRARSRTHDRNREGGATGPVRSLAGLPEEADRRSQPTRRWRAPSSASRSAPGRSRTHDAKPPPNFRLRTLGDQPDGHLRSPSPPNSRPRRQARAARLGELDHDNRSQAHRDHVHGHDVRVLHPGRRRGADDPPAAGVPNNTLVSPRSTTSCSRCTGRR